MTRIRKSASALFVITLLSSARPALPAPELTQTIFEANDSADIAEAKLRKASPHNPWAAVEFQAACHDFCAKFPDSPHYYQVRRQAVMYWSIFDNHGVSTYADGWDPTDAVKDPKLDSEQKADLAMLIANGRAIQSFHSSGGSFDDAQFAAVVAVLPPHRATKAARDSLIRAALMVAPQKAIPKLREFYPDDADAIASVHLLESLNQPCAFQFTSLDGRKIDSKDYRGKVVVLDFWAKGCGPCVALMPDLKKLAERLGPKGLAIIGVNMDNDLADAEEIIVKFGLTWPEHFDGKGWKNEIAQRFLVTSIPRCAAIDRHGILRFMAGGPTYQNAVQRIEALLAE